MGQFIEYCKIAFFNLKSNKIRALLTMLGIIIGISSVVMIVSLGTGFKKTINKEMDEIAGKYIEVYSYTSDFGFDREDFEAVEARVPHVEGTTPTLGLLGNASYKNVKEYKVLIGAGSEMREQYESYDIIKGRYFSKEENDNGEYVMVIDKGSARKIFGSTDVIGMTLDIEALGKIVSYKIVGVIDDSSDEMSNFAMHDTSYDIRITVPINSLSNQLGFEITPATMVVFIDDANNADEVAERTKRVLETRHECVGDNEIMVMNYNSYFSSINSVLTMITVLIMLVAGISLFVGGIGVMNIMLVSVTERTREIGIRKALGARTSSVLTQFLVESATISLVGGMIGTVIGLVGAELICLVLTQTMGETINADFNILFILGIALFSMSIGVIFGIIPARKAAKYNPIDALRSR